MQPSVDAQATTEDISDEAQCCNSLAECSELSEQSNFDVVSHVRTPLNSVYYAMSARSLPKTYKKHTDSDGILSIGRTGIFRVNLVVDLWEVAYADETKIRPCSHRVSKKGLFVPHTYDELMLGACSALRRARELSIDVESSTCMSGPIWPIYWASKGEVYLFTPRENGVSFVDERGGPYSLHRVITIMLINGEWDSYQHFGAVPGIEERRTVVMTANLKLDACGRSTTGAGAELAGTGDGKVSATNYGMPAISTRTLRALDYILDTGASHHLYGSELVKMFKKYIYI